MLKKIDNNELDIRRIMSMVLKDKDNKKRYIDDIQCKF